MFGDFGKDQDDEKALAMAVTLQHAGCLQRISVISNLGDSKMRARLAKGTLNVLEARHTAPSPTPDPDPTPYPDPDPDPNPSPHPHPNPHQARDTAVAVGSDGGRAGDTIHEYEFAGCTYLSSETELYQGTGTELALEAMRNAKAAGHQLSIVCNSAMTDMATLLEHPEWKEASKGVVGGVVMMSGATLNAEGGGVSLDASAQNNAFDLPSATKVLDHFQP